MTSHDYNIGHYCSILLSISFLVTIDTVLHENFEA